MRHELSDALGIINARKPVCIQRFPTGKYGLVGSVPLPLYDQEARRTRLWQTEQEVKEVRMSHEMDSNGNIPREYRYWPCPDPRTCEARNVSGHNPYYCPFGPEKDKRERLA